MRRRSGLCSVHTTVGAQADPASARSLAQLDWAPRRDFAAGLDATALLPAFARDVLHGNEQVASLLLVVFSIGIATGSLLCETLSRRHVEIGLVPFGSIGLSLYGIDLYFAAGNLPAHFLAQFLAYGLACIQIEGVVGNQRHFHVGNADGVETVAEGQFCRETHVQAAFGFELPASELPGDLPDTEA